MVAKYEAGTSSNQLMADHQLAKGTVLKVLRNAGATIRPKGRQQQPYEASPRTGPRA
ncbi:hypothetical protein GCM10027089_08550 [Nocardia thraciensis]